MSKSTHSKNQQDFTDEEIAKRRDKGLLNLLRTPPKPHDEITGKRKKGADQIDQRPRQSRQSGNDGSNTK